MAAATPRPYRHSHRWYVDGTLVTGTQAGTSWANAWRSLGGISWGSIGAGDVLYISGGTTSKTYTGGGSTTLLTVGASGSANRPILITKGIDSGHSGEVILDSQSGGRDGVDIISQTYITVQKLTVKNPGTGFDNFWITGSGNIIIQDCTINLAGSNNAGNIRGVEFRNASAPITIRRNYFDTAADATDQVDCVYGTVNNTAGFTCVVEGNNINQNNLNSTGHNDGIQIGTNTCDFLIRNNTVTVPSPGGANVHCMNLFDVNSSTARFTVYNNICNAIGASQSPCLLLQALSVSSVGRFYVYNNTLYHSNQAISLFTASSGVIHVLSEFKNNAIYMTAGTAWVNAPSWAPTSSAQVNYNDTYLTGAAVDYSGTHSGWNANGITTNPTFVTLGSDFHIQTSSGCKNAGTTVSDVLTDKDGYARPQGSAYCIGAYEFVS